MVAQRDHRDTGPTVGRESSLAAGQVDDDYVGAAGKRIGCVWPARGQVRQTFLAREDQPGGPGRIGFGLVLYVRKLFEPGPVGVVGFLGEHPDLQQVRWVEHG